MKESYSENLTQNKPGNLQTIQLMMTLMMNMGIQVVESSNFTKLERFVPKNQYTQRKLLNFENWCKGEGGFQKVSYLIFYVKNYPNLSQFFFIEEYQFRACFLLLTFLENFNF